MARIHVLIKKYLLWPKLDPILAQSGNFYEVNLR